MNERMKEIHRLMDESKLSPADKFEFGCDRCGRCCRNREDILLSPMDVYRISKYLSIPTLQMVNTYCERYQGSDSRVVVVRLLPKEYRKTCPFLSKDGCTIHEAKPTVCAIYPLGRAADPQEDQFIYFLQPVECGHKGEFHTVSDWLTDFHLQEEESVALLWMHTASKYAMAMHRIESTVPQERIKLLLMAMFFLFYVNYDLEKPFAPQLAENISAMEETFKRITGEELESNATL